MVAVFGLLTGAAAYRIAGDILARSQPVDITIYDIVVGPSAGFGQSRMLHVRMKSHPALNCIRTSQHLLYRDYGEERFYYPLGSAMNGVGFPMAVKEFRVVLTLPPILDQGDYYYIARSFYACEWLGGFFTRHISYQSPPQVVHIAP